MANKHYYAAESAENFEQKCLCVLLLDTSGSMSEIVDGNIQSTGKKTNIDGKEYEIVTGGKTKMDYLKEGLSAFYEDIANDPTSSQRLEISVVAFNSNVNVLQEPTLISNAEFPTLKALGGTAMADAINEAIDLVDARKQWYKETGQPYYRPWIILLTDGEPDYGQDILGVSARIKYDTFEKKYVFLPIGVGDADMAVLSQLTGNYPNGMNLPALKLSQTKFSVFFKWLSASMGAVVKADEGQKISLGTDTSWMEAFTI